jgi:hypothetical protein
MHTIADVISNILDLISGKIDGPNIRHCEKNFNRFRPTWTTLPVKRKATPTVSQARPTKQRKNNNSIITQIAASSTVNHTHPDPDDSSLPAAPWALTKDNLKVADKRAQMVRYAKSFDYTPADHFSRSWTLRTTHGKQHVFFSTIIKMDNQITFVKY